jgi:lipoate-protein ligase A
MFLWCDGGHDPSANMRRDAALLDAAGMGAEPVLRLFRFVPPGITLGRGQDPGRTLDLERCRRDGVAWAVRPTGGRAVFHDEEWTYSFASPLAHAEGAGSIHDAYARLSRLIVLSLARLGVSAALAPGTRDGRGSFQDQCFASTARHEIVRAGRKLVGSAQRRTACALLQQGSLLLGDSHARLADYLALPEAEREAARARLLEAATHAGDVLGARAPLEDWAEALAGLLPPGTERVSGEEGLRLLNPRRSSEARIGRRGTPRLHRGGRLGYGRASG